MLDILRNLRKSDEEKRQEALNAYLDGTLAPDQRKKVEKTLSQDAGQQAELDQIRLLRQEMRQLPSRRIPRSFTLDPALYGRPRREPLVQAYPVLRTATVLAAFFFVFALVANLFVSSAPVTSPAAESVAMQAAPEIEAAAEVAVEEEIGEAEIIEEEVGTIVTEVESVVPASEAPVMETEVVEESTAAELLPEEKAPVPEMGEALDMADAEASDMPEELQNASPFQKAEVSPEPMMTASADGGALQAEPTMAAAEAIDDAVPTSSATETGGETTLAESFLLPTAVAGDETARSVSEGQSQQDMVPFWASSLGFIVLLLGVVFVVLIALTLLAHRRL